jgi:hypothetical protein
VSVGGTRRDLSEAHNNNCGATPRAGRSAHPRGLGALVVLPPRVGRAVAGAHLRRQAALALEQDGRTVLVNGRARRARGGRRALGQGRRRVAAGRRGGGGDVGGLDGRAAAVTAAAAAAVTTTAAAAAVTSGGAALAALLAGQFVRPPARVGCCRTSLGFEKNRPVSSCQPCDVRSAAMQHPIIVAAPGSLEVAAAVGVVALLAAREEGAVGVGGRLPSYARSGDWVHVSAVVACMHVHMHGCMRNESHATRKRKACMHRLTRRPAANADTHLGGGAMRRLAALAQRHVDRGARLLAAGLRRRLDLRAPAAAGAGGRGVDGAAGRHRRGVALGGGEAGPPVVRGGLALAGAAAVGHVAGARDVCGGGRVGFVVSEERVERGPFECGWRRAATQTRRCGARGSLLCPQRMLSELTRALVATTVIIVSLVSVCHGCLDP